jgi:hypothetical protein
MGMSLDEEREYKILLVGYEAFAKLD